MSERFELRPIGVVRRDPPEVAPDEFFDPAVESTLVIDAIWEPALAGMENYSHLWVVFWFDRTERPEHPPPPRPAEGRDELPPVGLFSTRTPRRPNPIGLAVVRLLRRDGNHLVVTGLDAWNGTPILDLKGYNRRDDLRPEAEHPDWLERLWAMHDLERGKG